MSTPTRAAAIAAVMSALAVGAPMAAASAQTSSIDPASTGSRSYGHPSDYGGGNPGGHGGRGNYGADLKYGGGANPYGGGSPPHR
ncbi:MAG TPA: hypothetical protein VK501_18465 [Baekduia sp.]|uniref:hypothetical protein n=1 Tax=Baekduia sp. TaxID=2600305 RepID=UPI002C84D055|nr:hypothetical protein [Baekduia sp.]HMJ35894.1 hypothetical protein [Baekduia sp.]